VNFSDNDISQIENNGLTVEQIEGQIDLIKSGMIYSNLKSAATIGKGILKLDETQEKDYIDIFCLLLSLFRHRVLLPECLNSYFSF